MTTLALAHPGIQTNRRFWFWLVSYAIVGLGACYIYYVNQLIFDAVARQKLLERISQLEGNVATLEAKYLEASATITLETALAAGFHEANAHNSSFVSAPALAFAKPQL